MLPFVKDRFILKNPINSYIGNDFDLYIENGKCNIGDRFYARSRFNLELINGSIEVGDNVFINRDVSMICHEKIKIGSNTLIGESVKIYDHNHRFRNSDLISSQGFSSAPVIIGDNVWIGSNAVILKGVNIGNNSVVSAGSIVKVNIPRNSIFDNNQIIEINKTCY